MSKEKQIEELLNELIRTNGYGTLNAVANHLYEAGCRKQEWISVDERLPKELTHVIVCDEDGAVGEAFCYKEGRFEWIDSEEIAFVTHWMPLPEPPKMKEGEK